MARFHINSKGEAGACRATTGRCPFGSADEHFNSQREAMEALNERGVALQQTALDNVHAYAHKQEEEHDARSQVIKAAVTDYINANGGLDEQGLCRSFQPFTLLKTQEVLAEYNLTLAQYERFGSVDSLDLYEDMEGYTSDPWNELPDDLKEGWKARFQLASDRRDQAVTKVKTKFASRSETLKSYTKQGDGFEIGVAAADNEEPVYVAIHSDGSIYNLEPKIGHLSGAAGTNEEHLAALEAWRKEVYDPVVAEQLAPSSQSRKETYRHPLGKVIEVNADGSLTVTKDGKPARSNATLADLRSGRGTWKLEEV